MKKILALLLAMLMLLGCAAMAESQKIAVNGKTMSVPGTFSCEEDNGQFILKNEKQTIILVVNRYGAYTAQQILSSLLPGIRQQMLLTFPDAVFEEEGKLITCGDYQAVHYCFTSGGHAYDQYILGIDQDIWYFTADELTEKQMGEIIASIQ